METEYTVQFTLLLTGTAVSAVLAFRAWQRRPAPGSAAFAAHMLAAGMWALAAGLELTSISLDGKLTWATAKFAAQMVLPVAWLLFVRDYTGRPIRRLLPLALGALPLVSLLLLLTTSWHGLFWQAVYLRGTPPFTYLQPAYGPWYAVHVTFSYLCLLIGSIQLLRHWLQQPHFFRWQCAALLIGLLLPWAGNVLYLAGGSPIDLTPLAYALTGLLLMRLVLRYRLFDISPVAHRAVVDSLADGVLVLDSQQRIVATNPAARRMLPDAAEPLVGRPLRQVWPCLAARLAEETAVPFELPPCAGGQPTYEITVSPLLNERRMLQGRLLLLRDVSERKAQEALRADLTQAIVHDLRAPVSSALFALQLLKGDLAPVASPDDALLLDMTTSNTEKTLQLINQILDIHRLESGQLPLALEHVSLPELTACILSAQGARAAGKQLRLRHDVPAVLPAAWADAGLLERVLQNLVDNGIKFAPPGGQVTVSAREADAGGLLVSVSDDGPGVPPELETAIFDRYVTGTGPDSGSGLGLPFCRMVLEAHGQRIWLDGRAGQGATFTFTLACAAA